LVIAGQTIFWISGCANLAAGQIDEETAGLQRCQEVQFALRRA